ncbi:MAG: LptF/LptG family permease [Rubricoccaceae bacterium]|nr:LptF/LptG family permease [Rubricoccaceae bacterium]
MPKRLHLTVLRALPVPFLAAFGTLMFLLLMQFLIRFLPELVGRGLPAAALVELVAYSLAYMVTLAVPMAWLLALLAAFGRLSESRAYLVAKGAGVSLYQLAWPVLVVGALLVVGMGYFNNVMLPEANFRLAGLWRDIRLSRPGFELEPGVFYTGLDGYALRAETIPPDSAGLLLGVTVFDATEPSRRAVLVAERARLTTAHGGLRLEMTLEDGELHRREPRESDDRYERLRFARHRLGFDLSDLTFERRDLDTDARSDRTMRTTDMIAEVDSIEASVARRLAELEAEVARLGRPDTTARRRSPDLARAPAAADTTAPDTVAAAHPLLAGLGRNAQDAVVDAAVSRARVLRSEADGTANAVRWERQRADRYRVEIYKKNSIALACLVFVLIGVPLGLAVARGGVGLIATLAVGVFLFYWVTLVQGEKLADRGLLPPWLGMWAANVVVGLLGLYLSIREARDPAQRDPVRRLAGLFQRKR